MKKIIIIVSALLAVAGVSVVTATAGLASTSGEACVFNAPNEAVSQGHIGWGFELPGGNWEFGANEGAPKGSTRSNTWHLTGSAATMLATFAKGGPYHNTGYAFYRCARVPASNASAAEQQVKNEQGETYILYFRDCETQAFNVLSKYGVKFLPSDLLVPEPNSWFNLLYLAGFGSYTHLPTSAPVSPAPNPAPTSTAPSSPKTYVYAVYHTCANGACGLRFHSGPGYSNYPVTRVLVDGNAVAIVCQTRGQSVSGIDGSSSNVWDKTAQGDYAADFYIDTPGMTGAFSPPIPQC
jgi:hypothetical protein